MKTVLSALNAKYIHSNIAIRYLKSSAKEYNIELLEYTINENPTAIALDIISKKPDVIGFSCYIWNIEYTLKVCSTLKEIDKDLIIILGGPEVSYSGNKLFNSHPCIDYIIKGEGEKVFRELLYCLSNGLDMSSISGIVYRVGDEVYDNPGFNIIKDLNTIPFPYETDIPKGIVYYEASRGCPFSCSYCLSSTIREVRRRNLEKVKSELYFFIDKKIKLVKFVDRTFNSNKEFAMDIWRYLIENKADTTFHFEISADILDDEQIELLKSAPKGLFQFEIGVQTTNKDVLKNINRIMDFNKVKNNILKIKKGENIHCHMDLIAGLPGEKIDSFKRSFDMCMEIRPEVLQLGFLKVLEGTLVSKEKDRYGIHNISYPPYQVLYTKDLSIEEMRELINLEDVFETYYNSGVFEITMNYILDNISSPYDFFIKFSGYLSTKGFFKRNLSISEKYRLLKNFITSYNEELIINDILIHDFLRVTKKPWLPDFLMNNFSKQSNSIIKEKESELIRIFEKVDFKRILCLPVSIRAEKESGGYRFKKEDSYLVFDLKEGCFYYL